MFDDGEYSTKVYINTGYVDNFDPDDPELINKCIDLKNTAQPVLYKNLENISDIYIGNGVLATLGYQYSTKSYDIERESGSDVQVKMVKYNEELENYQNAVKTYSEGPDPIVEYYDKIKDAYDEYVEALTDYINNSEKEVEDDAEE